MEFVSENLQKLYHFSKSHAVVIGFVCVCTALFSPGRHFVFVERNSVLYSKLNVMLLILSRTLVALALSLFLHVTFCRRKASAVGRRQVAAAMLPANESWFKVISLCACFAPSYALLKSVLVLVSYFVPFVGSALLLAEVLWYFQTFSGGAAERQDSDESLNAEESVGRNRNVLTKSQRTYAQPSAMQGRTRTGLLYENLEGDSPLRSRTPARGRKTSAASRSRSKD